ncbi:hypothetical protein LCM20_15470 [Halobacillus litoralis]|uniref:VC0807 family protein n=1 Tax=Halobacillus litoralis TaxID=45668 RepID=UPI001CD3A48C|nr:VC0807 family protein [Halobacillus litoralis]MCA0972005.1 hypothetical protein [Halobacillus litoralis]
MKQKNTALLDVIFYLIFPLAVWHLMRDVIGDYYAMLLSSVPGILYTVYRFYALKKVNVFGIYMIATLVVGTLIDVLSGSAIRLLWNNVIYAYVMSGLFLVTILVRRPIALYFGVDFAEMQGYDRTFSKRLFFKKKLLRIFNWIVFGFALQDMLLATLKVWLIREYGVDAFDEGLILRQVVSWGLTIPVVLGFFHIGKVIQESPHLIKEVEEELKEESLAQGEKVVK